MAVRYGYYFVSRIKFTPEYIPLPCDLVNHIIASVEACRTVPTDMVQVT